MNIILLYSSITCGIIHFIYSEEVSLLEWLGVFTSIANHGTTCLYLQILDRAVMVVCFLSSMNNPIILVAALLYLVPNQTNSYLHLLSHILVTTVNIKKN